MCDDWGYESLHEKVEKRAIDEMKHAEKLIQRILFLEGQPIVSSLNPIHIGKDVPSQISHDRKAEEKAIKNYQQYIQICLAEGDAGTRELFEHILQDEEDHLDWLESQEDQIQQMGLENYLLQQV